MRENIVRDKQTDGSGDLEHALAGQKVGERDVHEFKSLLVGTDRENLLCFYLHIGLLFEGVQGQKDGA